MTAVNPTWQKAVKHTLPGSEGRLRANIVIAPLSRLSHGSERVRPQAREPAARQCAVPTGLLFVGAAAGHLHVAKQRTVFNGPRWYVETKNEALPWPPAGKPGFCPIVNARATSRICNLLACWDVVPIFGGKQLRHAL